MNLVIGYVGLTHLGINYAVASAIKGFRVVCYDENENLILSLQKQKIPFFEKNLDINLKKKNLNILNLLPKLKIYLNVI